MNIKKKIIPRLEIKSGNLIKGIRMEGLRVVSKDLKSYIKKYIKMGVKEIFVEDIVASLFNRSIDFETIKLISSHVNIPLSYAGGIKSIQDIHKLFKNGVDKIYINSSLKNDFKLLNEASNIYGSQSVGVLIQTRRIFNNWYIFFESGRIFSNIKTKEWISRSELNEAGEMIICSIMHDGTVNGPDLELIKFINDLDIKIPVIYSGGLRDLSDVKQSIKKNINSVAIAHALHFNKFE